LRRREGLGAEDKGAHMGVRRLPTADLRHRRHGHARRPSVAEGAGITAIHKVASHSNGVSAL